MVNNLKYNKSIALTCTKNFVLLKDPAKQGCAIDVCTPTFVNNAVNPFGKDITLDHARFSKSVVHPQLTYQY